MAYQNEQDTGDLAFKSRAGGEHRGRRKTGEGQLVFGKHCRRMMVSDAQDIADAFILEVFEDWRSFWTSVCVFCLEGGGALAARDGID